MKTKIELRTRIDFLQSEALRLSNQNDDLLKVLHEIAKGTTEPAVEQVALKAIAKVESRNKATLQTPKPIDK